MGFVQNAKSAERKPHTIFQRTLRGSGRLDTVSVVNPFITNQSGVKPVG